MIKNQRGDVLVIVVVLLVIALVIGLGLWAAFSTEKRSDNLLKKSDTVHSNPKKEE
jgi:hypothetical protein